jgi:hypothetical protein
MLNRVIAITRNSESVDYVGCVMTRHVLRAIDFGASVVFMAFCVKALLTHLYKDLRLQQQQQRLAVFKDAPSLMPARAIAVRKLLPAPTQSTPDHPHRV